MFTLYTDGGCHGNPGPGGWAFVLEYDGKRVERNGAEYETTNNRMELQAVIAGLSYVNEIGTRPVGSTEERGSVTVYTDSQYVKNGITSWIHNWLRNGWRTSAKKPVKNRDLWMTLHELTEQLDVQWEWLRGHAGHDGNERCDLLVQKAIQSL